MSIETVLKIFSDLLAVRLEKGVYTTEDSIRYTFFSALLSAPGIKPEDIVLEFPHPAISRAKIDTYMPDFNGGVLAVEFKYDRQIPSGKNMPRPQKAGAAFRDVARLSQIKTPKKSLLLFIYLTDSEMAAYFSNPANGLDDYFFLRPGQKLTMDNAYLAPRSTTLKNTAGEVSASLSCLSSCSMPHSHALRVYQVVSIPSRS